jgi:hypothetical protein
LLLYNILKRKKLFMSSAAATADSSPESESSWNSVALTAMFTAAVTTFVVGFPMDFAREALMFPFFHGSTPGLAITDFSGGLLMPFYEAVGEFFGLPSQFSGELGSLPSTDLSF